MLTFWEKTQNPRPQLIPSIPGKIAQIEPDFGVAPALPLPSERGSITAAQATAMGRELENLIGRFESSLLAANAINSNVNLQTGAAIDPSLVATEVDGIQLDYIRYPFQDPTVNQTYGYGKAARQMACRS